MSFHRTHQVNTCAAAGAATSVQNPNCKNSEQDQLLMTAEAVLKDGQLERAEQLLQVAMAAGTENLSSAYGEILSRLQENLMIFKPLVDAAQLAAARCCWREAILQAQSCLLAIQHPTNAPGLAVKMLMIKADAASNLLLHETALEALDLALQMQPGIPEALWKRAAAHAVAGNHQASFFDLKQLGNLQPAYPGIMQALQHAARSCSEQRTAHTRVSVPEQRFTRNRRYQPTGAGTRCCHADSEALQGGLKKQDAYRVLGLSPSASVDDIKRGYKQLAAKLHPDKWMQASAEDRAAAEEKFKAVSAAYQALMARG